MLQYILYYVASVGLNTPQSTQYAIHNVHSCEWIWNLKAVRGDLTDINYEMIIRNVSENYFQIHCYLIPN